jgi:hypothetical protein
MSRNTRVAAVAVYGDGGGGADGAGGQMREYTRKFLVSFTGSISEIESGGLNGLVWQPLDARRVFHGERDTTGSEVAGVGAPSGSALDNVYLKRITLLGYRSTFPINVGVRFTDPDTNVYGMEATVDGRRFAHTTLARSSSTTPEVVYTETSSDATIMWRTQFPKYTKHNLMTEGVLRMNNCGFIFVHESHPAIMLIQTSKETLCDDAKTLQKVDNEYYKMSHKTLAHVCEMLQTKVLYKVSNTNLNDFTVSLAPITDTCTEWDGVCHCDRFIGDVVGNCVASHTEFMSIASSPNRPTVERSFLDMTFTWSARYEIQYSLPVSGAPGGEGDAGPDDAAEA